MIQWEQGLGVAHTVIGPWSCALPSPFLQDRKYLLPFTGHSLKVCS
jgi:hypothetical protein